MASGGPFELRPAFVGETVEIVCTIDGSGTIAGQSYEMKVWDRDGAEVESGVSCSITGALAREVTGQFLIPDSGRYHWSIRRTDSYIVAARGDVVCLDDEKE